MTQAAIPKRAALAALFFLFSIASAFAQGVRPLVVEYRAEARGRFEVVNASDWPLYVVLEPMSFDVDANGDAHFRALDSNIHLKLSVMSFRVAAKQSYFVFYSAKADILPAWFVIYASIGSPSGKGSGMNVRIDLPHTVYVLPKGGVARSDVEVKLALDRARGQLLLEVRNTGPQFSRVLACEIAGAHAKALGGSFPLFPHSVRRLNLAWSQEERPEKVMVRFQHLRFEQEIPREGIAATVPSR